MTRVALVIMLLIQNFLKQYLFSILYFLLCKVIPEIFPYDSYSWFYYRSKTKCSIFWMLLQKYEKYLSDSFVWLAPNRQ